MRFFVGFLSVLLAFGAQGLRLSGDEVPKPLPVLNVDIETPSFVSSAAIAVLKAEMAQLQAAKFAQASEYSALASVMAASRAKAQK